MAKLCNNFRDPMTIICIDEYLFVDAIDRNIHIKKDFSLPAEAFTHAFTWVVFMDESFSSLFVLSLLVAYLTAYCHSCKSLVHIFDLEIRFYLWFGLRNGWFMHFGGLGRDVFLFRLFVEEVLHRAYFIDLCLSCLCLLIEIMTLFSPDILIMRLLEISLSIGLECAFRVFFSFLLFPYLLFF